MTGKEGFYPGSDTWTSQFSSAMADAPNGETQHLIIETALEMVDRKSTSQKRLRPVRVPKNPGKSRK